MLVDQIYYRPVWTCGRYDADTKSAIMYNLIAGLSFFFEDRSAEIIGVLLSSPRGGKISKEELSAKSQVDIHSINDFMEKLLDLGLLSEVETREQMPNKQSDKVLRWGSEKRHIHQNFDGLPVPVSNAEKDYICRVNKKAAVVMMELTYNCSEQCIHCYNPGATRNSTEKSYRNNREKLTLEQYKSIIDQLDAEGTFLVCLTGGDPFSNPYAWDIIDYLYHKEIAFEVFTNGQSIYGKEAQLANYFPCYVAVSIYSAIDKVHDSITRVPGSLTKSLSVLDRLQHLCIPLVLKCVIMRNNLHSYRTVAELGQKFKAEVQFDCRLFDSSEGDKCVSNFLRLTPKQLRVAFRDRLSLYYVGEEVRDYGAIEHLQDEPACLTGFNNLCITPEGYVIPCCCFHTILGDVKRQSLHCILYGNELLEKLTSLKLSEYEECGTHNYCDFCILCPGLNFSENGDPKVAAENNCYYAKVRYQLYLDLKHGVDPLEGKDIDTALKELPVENHALKHIPSVSHFNKKLSL